MLMPMNSQPHNIIIRNTFSSEALITIYLGDRLGLLKQIAETGEKAELIITSPPYNIGKEYEEILPLNDYIMQQRETIQACIEVLSTTGSICWQVGHHIQGSSKQKEAFPLDIIMYPIFKEFGLKLRNRIVWLFGHGLHETYRLSGRHETILWFTRDTDEYTFNLDSIRVPQKYPGKKAFRGPRKGKPSGNPLGKNPSDVWEIPNVKANHVESTIHPSQFPVGLVERLVLALTNQDDLVIDPYFGVGTTGVASLLHGRRIAGSDTMPKYLDIARERILHALSGDLKVRPLDKPVHQPDPNSKLTQIPDDWIVQ
jgi:adenine-specific DNA-methyltransferase